MSPPAGLTPSPPSDREEILQLLHRYNHLIDGEDAAAWAETFLSDGVFHVDARVMSGRGELIAFASGVRGLRHTVVNPVIDVNGDTAIARAYCVVYQGTNVFIVGSYEDQLVKTTGGWRFATRTFSTYAQS